jgi:hypothetical protein
MPGAVSNLYQINPTPVIRNKKYMYWVLSIPINDRIIARIEQIKLENMNALDACLPSLIDPIIAIIHITPSMIGMKVPPTPSFTNLNNSYKFDVPLPDNVG